MEKKNYWNLYLLASVYQACIAAAVFLLEDLFDKE
jgi:hypothetical protein